MIFPSLEKKIFKYLPKREELLLRNVLAFPKASKMGLDCSNCRSINASLFAALSLPDTSNWLSGPARKKRNQKKKKREKVHKRLNKGWEVFKKEKWVIIQNESSTPKKIMCNHPYHPTNHDDLWTELWRPWHCPPTKKTRRKRCLQRTAWFVWWFPFYRPPIHRRSPPIDWDDRFACANRLGRQC